MNDLPAVAACLIVKNAENFIGKAIASVQEHVDEVICVDTGSEDGTLSVISSLQVKTFRYPWDDHFAKARNYAASLTKCNWVLFIDSDEVFTWNSNEESLKSYIGQFEHHCDWFVLCCFNREPDNAKQYAITHVERLFKKDKFQYQGAIHEYLVGSTKDRHMEIPSGLGHINHFGYSPSFLREKSSRNTRILIRQMHAHPDDGLLYRYMANELFNNRQYNLSIHNARRALDLLPRRNMYARAQSYYYIMMAYTYARDFTRAILSARQAVREIPEYADSYAVLFDCYAILNQPQAALEAFRKWEYYLERDSLLPNNLYYLYDSFLQKKASILEQEA